MLQNPLHIVGGVYAERCVKPDWFEIYGSAGRAASAIATVAQGAVAVELHCYTDGLTEHAIQARSQLERVQLNAKRIGNVPAFAYQHGLSPPRVDWDHVRQDPIQVTAQNVLRFGALESDAIVHGDRVVYDPQNPVNPELYQANGSTAKELVIVTNEHEARLMVGGLRDIEEVARLVRDTNGATAVIIKRGARGALVCEGHIFTYVSAYRTSRVWKIGSGDVFAAHFAFGWLAEGRSILDSAQSASKATAYYCQTSSFPTQVGLSGFNPIAITTNDLHPARRRKAYIAGPFFTLPQLWLIEQARNNLRELGLEVFSPYHDVGHGSADDVVALDLRGVEDSDVVFAICDGLDAGTIFEVGYARAKGIATIIYCENESDEDLKMMSGSGCVISRDYVTAIYQTLWALEDLI